MNRRRKIEPKKKNFCCAFILPMVGVNYKNTPTNFINAYITSDYEVVMIFDKTEDFDEIFYHFMENVKTKNSYLAEHIDEEDEIIFKFNVPKIYHTDFDLFKKGKYSYLSDNYKKILVNYFGTESRKNDYKANIYNAIYPQDFKRLQIAEMLYSKQDLREGLKLIYEVLDSPYLDLETFNTIQQLTQNNTITTT